MPPTISLGVSRGRFQIQPIVRLGLNEASDFCEDPNPIFQAGIETSPCLRSGGICLLRFRLEVNYPRLYARGILLLAQRFAACKYSFEQARVTNLFRHSGERFQRPSPLQLFDVVE